ncbi:SdpI family protein [Lactobacillus agrestimuris]|uniref:SdpI family protein n=1 Tax=Lactobacillus agrestimuris TaxID=2941328 RepID=UPI00204334E3|nr:SdpI family protein [Lactobacillus agrestimuris]
MIYIACASVMIAIGLIWLISPAKKPNRIYGYLSYLAQVNKDSFKYAQKMASFHLILFGAIQFCLGLIIYFLGWDRYFFIWLLTFYLFIIFPIVWTEKSLKRFLRKRDELPHDYVDPDKVRHEKVKGFKDR